MDGERDGLMGKTTNVVKCLSVEEATWWVFNVHWEILTSSLYVENLPHKALAGVAQWIEHRPANERVAGSIPSQGTGLGCRPGAQ